MKISITILFLLVSFFSFSQSVQYQTKPNGQIFNIKVDNKNITLTNEVKNRIQELIETNINDINSQKIHSLILGKS